MQRRPSVEPNEPKAKEPIVKREKLKHRKVLEITNRTTSGQLPIINGWNEMRERLLELGEMEKES